MCKFDLEKALAGKKVVTRNGHEASQFKVFHGIDNVIFACVINGQLAAYEREDGLSVSEREYDLLMAPKKLSGFVNVWSDYASLYDSKSLADEDGFSSSRLACIDLSQFEEGHGL